MIDIKGYALHGKAVHVTDTGEIKKRNEHRFEVFPRDGRTEHLAQRAGRPGMVFELVTLLSPCIGE